MWSWRASIAATTWVLSSSAISGAANPASVERPIADFPAASAMPRAAGLIGCNRGSSHGSDFDHVRQIMAQQVLDAVPERRGRRWAARAGALHVEIDDTVLEAAEGDVAAVIGNRRPHPRFDQLFDDSNRFGILLFEEFIALRRCS